eukprot:48793-Amphidinium_carterae.1
MGPEKPFQTYGRTASTGLRVKYVNRHDYMMLERSMSCGSSAWCLHLDFDCIPHMLVILHGCSRPCKEDISKAYRKLALKHHPDKTDESGRIAAAERFKNIARAYEVLRDDLRRWRYDET